MFHMDMLAQNMRKSLWEIFFVNCIMKDRSIDQKLCTNCNLEKEACFETGTKTRKHRAPF